MPIVSAQVSLYPLGEPEISPMIDEALDVLTRHNLTLQPGRMSTLVTGDAESVFAALNEAFAQAAGAARVVMVATISNACPMDEPQEPAK